MFRYVFILAQTNVHVKAIHPTPDFIGRGFLVEGYKNKSLEDAQVVMRDIANNRMSYYLMPKEDEIDINGDRK